eukprot:GFUD01000781.1.p1 GENE.GFUD01000781.1~~GFUD01000781.1.p1  ORF type:complete len:937 (+),score=231.94 GFUD01000781.1:203-3013(+)
MSNIKSKVGRLPSNLNTPHRMNEGPLESENGKVHPSTVPPPNIPGPTNSQLMYLKNTVMQAVWNHKLSWPFQAPVDAMKSDIPDYHKTIKHPMDFGTIKKRLDDNYYWSAEECIKDFKRVFLNCYVYNKGGEGKAGEEVVMAQTVEKLFLAKLASMPKEEQEADPSPIETQSTEPAKHNYSFDGEEIPENEIVTVFVFGIKKDTTVAWNFHNNKPLELNRLAMVEKNAPPLIFMHKGNLIDPLGWCTPKSLDIKNDDYILVLRPLELREHWDDESRITLIMVDRERMLRYGKLKLNEKLEVKYLKQNLEKLLKLKHSFSLVHDGLILGDDDTLEGAGIVDNECIALVDLKGDVSDRHLERLLINTASQNKPCNIAMDKSTVVPVGEPRGMRIIHNLDTDNLDGHENEKCAEVCKSLLERIKTKFVGELTAALSTQDDVQSKFSDLIASKMFNEHAHAGDLLSDIHETLILLKAKHKIEDSVWKDVMGRVIDFYMIHTDSVFKNSCGRYYEPFDCDSFSSFESFPIFLETVLYIGPKRDGKPRPNQTIVKLRAFTSQTTIQDVINSYKVYAKLSNCKITGLSFNNRLASPTELVSQVLGGLFEKNYLMFSDVIEASNLGELDNLVEFIEGKKEEKIQRKKKKVKDNKIPKLDEVSQAEVCEAPLEHHLDIPNMSILTENMSLEVSDDDTGSCRKKLLLEASLKSKTDLLNENKSIVEQLFGSKSKEMKDLLIQMSQVEDANMLKGKRMTSIDLEINDLEARVAKLKEEKHLNKEEMDLAKTKVQKLNIKRIKLETYIETEMKKRKERENELKSDIKDVEEKIKALDISSTSGKSNEFGSNDETADKDPKQKLLDFLTTSILEKKEDLECPVCLDTATIPIYSCLESHLICSSCRPKVVECPECRVEYGDMEVLRRHRYAEKTAIELERLKEERRTIL